MNSESQGMGGDVIALSDLLSYDRWANHKYLDVIAQLPEEQFTRIMGGSFASIRDTLVHLAWAEWVWTERWQKRSPKVRAVPDQFPTCDSVRSYLKGVEEAQVRLFENSQPDMVAVRIRYTNLKHEAFEYTLEQMVHHLATHSAYHRGQLATLMRQLGVVPPTTDYLDYVDNQKGAGA
jgi:uncharacterized damage-inducible protein DinB